MSVMNSSYVSFAKKNSSYVSIIFLLVLCQCVCLEAHLKVGFYAKSCAKAEMIVKQEVKNSFSKNKGVAAGLVRLHFHDCFVRGCDASVLIDSTSSNTAEKDSPANNPSLRGFEVIDKAKETLEDICPGVVSCADILAFAARDSIKISGWIHYDVPSGRRDGRVSLIEETIDLPPPTFNVKQLTRSFSSKGLTQEEMVTLSGAHSIGRSHCTTIIPRLYNFSTTINQDPTIDPKYAKMLKQQCPPTSDLNSVVPMNPSTPNIMDASYYNDVAKKRGLFSSDQALFAHPSTKTLVRQNIKSPTQWSSKFGAAMVKMGNIGVLTGSEGEVRTNCRKIN